MSEMTDEADQELAVLIARLCFADDVNMCRLMEPIYQVIKSVRAEAALAERERMCDIFEPMFASAYYQGGRTGSEAQRIAAATVAPIRARTATQGEVCAFCGLPPRADGECHREEGWPGCRTVAAPQPPASCPQEGGMREAAQRVIDDIHDYERINSLAPNPGRMECWDSVAALIAALAHDAGAKP